MATLVTSNLFAFADGNTGHACALGSAPNVGEFDLLGVNSDTVVSTPSGFTLGQSNVNSQGAYFFYRKAVGGESSSVTITTSGNFNCQVSHSRWSGLNALDVTAKTSVTSSPLSSTPAVSTGTLGATGELVVAFAALHSLGAPAASAPVWSTGFTAVTGPNPQGGAASSAVDAFVGYKDGAGTTAEAPSVSWTSGPASDRDILVMTFTAAAGGGVNGVLAGVLPALTSALTGTSTDSAVLAGQLPALVSALTGTSADRAALAGVLPALVSAVTGTSTDRATLAGTLPALVSALEGGGARSGVLAATLPALAAALTGAGPAGATTPGQLRQYAYPIGGPAAGRRDRSGPGSLAATPVAGPRPLP